MVGFRYAVAFLIVNHMVFNVESYYSNVTLTSASGDLSVVVYLPRVVDDEGKDINNDGAQFYLSSRFDHSSMIGSISRTTRDEYGHVHTHVLYGADRWRVPHDPYWPESGVGLASEFGVGDDGAFCNYRCGWYEINDVTNGLLGYRTARIGEPFLKIGVGTLIKGSCTTCDSSEDYKFNSPYKFYRTPSWTMQKSTDGQSITLEQEEIVNAYGYRLRKDISLVGDELLVKSTLTNRGRDTFSTAWYSHHFFTCDGRYVGKGYELDVQTDTGGSFEEPAAWFWSTPIRDFARIIPKSDALQVEMFQRVYPGTRVKAEFTKDASSTSEFTLKACGTAIKEVVPEITEPGGVSMYAFNIYIEEGTLSPEPQILIQLEPGRSLSWTQKLTFSDNYDEAETYHNKLFRLKSVAPLVSGNVQLAHFSDLVGFVLIVCSAVVVVYVARKKQRREYYTQIPNQ